MAYDSNRLYLLYEVRQSPMKNAGGDWRTLFRSGASVDLQMSVKPDIPQDREAPAEGDLRLLVTFIDSKPIAVLYCPVVPGTPPGSAFEVVSPVGKVVIDEVRRLDDIEVAVTGSRGYSLEASIPIAPLGFKPELGQRYRFDWGILTTDDYGNACTARIYWSNKATGILADAPSEARLMPNLWGFLRVHEYPRAGPVDLHSLSTLDDRGKETTDAIDVEKEFEEKGED
jgi:hypothetical protein